jgi:hypothetical protein
MTSNVTHDAIKLFDGSQAGINVRRPKARAKQVITTKNVQRQKTIILIVAVEEAARLMTVNRVICGIQIQNDFFRWRGM